MAAKLYEIIGNNKVATFNYKGCGECKANAAFRKIFFRSRNVITKLCCNFYKVYESIKCNPSICVITEINKLLFTMLCIFAMLAAGSLAAR